MKGHIQLRWYHFLISWFLCLFTGFIVGIIISVIFGSASEAIEISAAVNGVAMAASAPFIILFCIIVHFSVLKKKRTKDEIHLRVFIIHLIGSILVFIGILFFLEDNRDEIGFYIMALMAGYFTVDSVYFHLSINRKAVNESYENTPELELLDSGI